jgi:hypothetical protein
MTAQIIEQRRNLPDNVPMFIVDISFHGTKGRERKRKFQMLTIGYIAKSGIPDNKDELIEWMKDVIIPKILAKHKVKTHGGRFSIKFDHCMAKENGIFTWEPFHDDNFDHSWIMPCE